MKYLKEIFWWLAGKNMSRPSHTLSFPILCTFVRLSISWFGSNQITSHLIERGLNLVQHIKISGENSLRIDQSQFLKVISKSDMSAAFTALIGNSLLGGAPKSWDSCSIEKRKLKELLYLSQILYELIQIFLRSQPTILLCLALQFCTSLVENS